jgi:hypothetical protein
MLLMEIILQTAPRLWGLQEGKQILSLQEGGIGPSRYEIDIDRSEESPLGPGREMLASSLSTY